MIFFICYKIILFLTKTKYLQIMRNFSQICCPFHCSC